MITIWCLSKYAAPPRYGVGARLFYIAEAFSKLGARVLLISSDANHLANYPKTESVYNEESYGDLQHLWIKTHKYHRSASAGRFLSWLDFELKLFRLNTKKYGKPDAVIVSSLSLLTILYGVYLKKKYGCKLIFEVRDIYPLTLTEEFGVSQWNPVVLALGLLEKMGYRHADCVVGTMPNLREHVALVAKKKVDVFYSPIGIHEVWGKELSYNQDIDLLFTHENSLVVGYAGSMGISNAMDPFIETIKMMKNYDGISFVLVGDGDRKESYIDKLQGLPNVTVGPRISQRDIPYFLSKCDVLYLSTHKSKMWNYGQSLNKMIDYMMAGKPVIASYSGYQSMLNEAGSGIFVPVGDIEAIRDAILQYKAMDAQEREAIGQRGRKWMESHNSYMDIASSYYKKILSLFDSE